MTPLRLAVALIAAMIATMPTAHAQIGVSEVLVDIGGDQPFHDMAVGNTGKQIMFVQVDVIEILDPGTSQQSEIEHTNPQESDLLTTPTRMILNEGECAIARIAPVVRNPSKDRVYWVRIRPVEGEEDPEQSVIRLVDGYDILVIVRPPQPAPEFEVERVGNLIRATDTGNTMVALSYGEQCDGDGIDCVEAPSKRLYAGMVWEAEQPRNAAVNYIVNILGVNTREQS